MGVAHFKSYSKITDDDIKRKINNPYQKLTTSIVITNVTNIQIRLFSEDIQQLK